MIQICEEPLRSETKAMRLESGDQRGRSAASAILRGAPPASGTIQICCGLLFFSTSMVCVENATQRHPVKVADR